VTWWQSAQPDRIAYDPLGVVADRRITDCAQADDPITQLGVRADDYAPGDTDLAWTRITPWRTLVASALDTVRDEIRVTGATIAAPARDPSAALLGGWLHARLGLTPELTQGSGDRISDVRIELSDGAAIEIARDNGNARLCRTGLPERTLPLVVR